MRALSGLCFVVLVSSVAVAQEDTSDSVWAGTWTLNVAKSTSNVDQETMKIEAPGGHAHPVKYTDKGTSADGTAFTIVFDGKADGNPYPLRSNGQEVAKAVLRRQSSHHYTLDETYPDGTKVSLTLTFTTNGKVATGQEHDVGRNGHIDETTVWEKQP